MNSRLAEETKNILVGAFVIAACTLLVVFIMYLKPHVGDGKKHLYVRFSNINKISVGTRVTYAGEPVGEVESIRSLPDFRQQRVDELGRYYIFELVLKLDSRIVVYTTDLIELQTSGLLGERSVAIIPQEPPKGVIPKIVTDQPIYANSVDPIENTFHQLSNITKDVSEWLDKYGDTMGGAIQSFGNAMDEVNNLIKEDVKTTMQSITGLANKMQKTLDDIECANIVGNLGSTLQSVSNITQDIASGQGTIGQLVKSDDLYLRFTAVMSKVDTMMNDINHYGLLFHLNKGWQRTRTKQMNTLNALQTPSQFRSYFQTEVDQINTSMSRLSILIEKAQESPESERILESEPFKKDFRELYRLSEELSDNLRLYNQQLMSNQ